MKNKLRVIAACVAAIALCASGEAFAAPKKSPSPAPSPSASPVTAIPDNGRDQGSRHSVPRKDCRGRSEGEDVHDRRQGKVARFQDHQPDNADQGLRGYDDEGCVVNEELRGSYWKATDGSLRSQDGKARTNDRRRKLQQRSRRKRRRRKRKLRQTLQLPLQQFRRRRPRRRPRSGSHAVAASLCEARYSRDRAERRPQDGGG